MSECQEPQGLRLLSLDNGVIRGLSELLILREILQRIQCRLGLRETPLPCECFDMIGGTGTGGLIALMLGRLGMSVEDAIIRYERLATEVFGDVKPFARDEKPKASFKASKLEGFIRNIVKEKTGEMEGLMMNSEAGVRQCKTFVCAMPGPDETPNIPHFFRSYPAPKYQTANCKIWEAGRATSTFPASFKSIIIGTPGSAQRFVNGGRKCNNPTKWVLEEAELIFPGRPIACILSIGAGQHEMIKIPMTPLGLFHRSLPLSVIEHMKHMAGVCEWSEQDIDPRFRNTLNVYFRFNVDCGLQPVELAAWDRFPGVTDQYLRKNEVDHKLDSAVLVVQGKLNAVTIPEDLKPPRAVQGVDYNSCEGRQDPQGLQV